MQHDVFPNPGRRSKSIQPFFVVLQSDFATSANRLACPLFHARGLIAGKALLSIRFHGGDYMLAMELITPIPTSMLRRSVGSLGAYRDDIIRALDWLFVGL